MFLSFRGHVFAFAVVPGGGSFFLAVVAGGAFLFLLSLRGACFLAVVAGTGVHSLIGFLGPRNDNKKTT